MIDAAITWPQIIYTILFGFVLYYLTQVVHKPKFYCNKEGSFYQDLKDYLTELDKDQWPLLWCYWPLWQAGFHTLIMPPQKFDFERSVLKKFNAMKIEMLHNKYNEKGFSNSQV